MLGLRCQQFLDQKPGPVSTKRERSSFACSCELNLLSAMTFVLLTPDQKFLCVPVPNSARHTYNNFLCQQFAYFGLFRKELLHGLPVSKMSG
ncbi:hypothetical protein AVEN_255086-1 [Araneus ventricosus]|uniref:Uncharacterized protein n=1 Tax=Araneus ventricosus TaxID=182803 RepID=A0A4Y2EG43_ARAVE|nr:hypothetical protein AVEN_255086-1 [Araneus ventricosus]